MRSWKAPAAAGTDYTSASLLDSMLLVLRSCYHVRSEVGGLWGPSRCGRGPSGAQTPQEGTRLWFGLFSWLTFLEPCRCHRIPVLYLFPSLCIYYFYVLKEVHISGLVKDQKQSSSINVKPVCSLSPGTIHQYCVKEPLIYLSVQTECASNEPI